MALGTWSIIDDEFHQCERPLITGSILVEFINVRHIRKSCE